MKILILFLARAVGGFRLARWLTRHQLRILCYHGAAIAGEDAFRGGLFISPERFRRRLNFLAQAGYPVLELGPAVERLKAGTALPCATVITIDDGWVGTAWHMAPALRDHHFPATLYLATYYVDKQTQVFNVAVDYLLWRSAPQCLDLAQADPRLSGSYEIGAPSARELACEALIALAETLPDAAARQHLLRRVGETLGMDADALEQSRVMSFMTYQEAATIRGWGIDLQLHTHRHRLPTTNYADLAGELDDNRRALTAATNQPLVHFCYPSGEYVPGQLAWLENWGVRTATTTKTGFNYRDTPPLELRRFLDSEAVSDVEFEAEMAGFLELLRRFRHGP